MPFVFYLLGCPFLEAIGVSCPEAGVGPQERGVDGNIFLTIILTHICFFQNIF